LFSFSFLVGVGCLQGILLALYLATKKGVSRMLALYLTLIATNMGVSFYIDSGLFEPSMSFIPMWRSVNTYLLFGPLVTYFVILSIYPQHRRKWIDYFHYLPFVVMSCLSLTAIYSHELPFSQYMNAPLLSIANEPLSERFDLSYLLPASHFVSYLIFSTWHVFKFWLKNRNNKINEQLSWLIGVLAISYFMMLSIFTVLIISIISGQTHSPDTFAIANLSTVILFFALTYLLIQCGHPVTVAANDKEGVGKRPHDPSSQKEMSKKELSYEQKQQLNELDSLMLKEKLYLNTQLTQLDLANTLAVTRHQLSLLLKEHHTGNFYELINQYRVSAVIEAMKTNPAKDSLITIAYASGFNSKSTFNQVFKKHTGQTPGSYRKGIKQMEQAERLSC